MDAFDQLIATVKRLRDPDGCPWDKEQTFQSLTPHIIEEAYELVDAMEKGNMTDLKEEVGDVMLHVVMLSNMAEETGDFSVKDVAEAVNEKMIRRHPHVFSDTKANTVDDVWENWDKIKAKEKPQGPFDSIPKQLPALLQAKKAQKKAARLGFDWPDNNGPLEKIVEEAQELKAELDNPNANPEKCQEELGDLLFSVVNLARKYNLDPEEALRHSNQKFMNRVSKVSTLAEANGNTLSDLDLNALDALWEQAKQG